MLIISIILFKTHYSKESAIAWLKAHSKLYEIEENKESYIAIQIDPYSFDKYSFRLKEINAGLDFVIGMLRTQ